MAEGRLEADPTPTGVTWTMGDRAVGPAPSSGLQPGQICGPYRLVRLLGTGGFAEVWEVERIADGRYLALKLLSALRKTSAEAVERFEREGRLAASLSHPRAVYVVAAEVIDGLPTIAMELVKGGSLQDRLAQEGRIGVTEAVDAILDVIEGLEAAQHVGIVHRDVKPSNCYLDDEGRVKIGDFGISKSLDVARQLTVTGSFLGTPAYAAPEQIRGSEADMRSDLYAVGATLYALLTGNPPFRGKTAGDLLALVVSERAAPLAAHGVRAARKLESIVQQLLAKEPQHRPAGYTQLRAALMPFSSTGFLPAPPERRVGAFIVDSFLILLAVSIIFLHPEAGSFGDFLDDNMILYHEDVYLMYTVIQFAVSFLYYWLIEGLWQRSPGKALLGLWVRKAADESASTLRVAARSLLFSFPILLLLIWPDQWGEMLLQLAGLALICSSMRRDNGYAGWHELLTGTRVRSIRKIEMEEMRPGTVQYASSGGVPAKHLGSRGPYRLAQTLWSREDESLFLARDEGLRRDVWIHERCGREEQIPERDNRLRWLRGGTYKGLRWDAYAAPTGASLVQRIGSEGAVGWSTMRLWLSGLIREIEVSIDRIELPKTLALCRVWIDDEECPKLLPFPAPGSPKTREHSSERWPGLLRDVAAAGLEGRVEHRERVGLPPVCLPEHGRRFLSDLWQCQADRDRLAQLNNTLQELLHKPVIVSRRQRVSHLVGTWAILWVALLGGMAFELVTGRLELGEAINPIIWVNFSGEIFPFALLSVAAAFVIHGGPMMRLFGLTLQNAKGQPISRLRSGLRAVVAWSPILIVWIPAIVGVFVSELVFGAGNTFLEIYMGKAGEIIVALLLLIFFAGVVAAILLPERGWQDRMAGTRIVRV